MTAELTSNNVANASSNLMQTNYSNVKSGVKSDDKTFSNVLDNASKTRYTSRESQPTPAQQSQNMGNANKTGKSETRPTVSHSQIDSNVPKDTGVKTENTIGSQVEAKPAVTDIVENTPTDTVKSDGGAKQTEIPKEVMDSAKEILSEENTDTTDTTTTESTDTDITTTDTTDATGEALTDAAMAAIANESILANVDFVAPTAPMTEEPVDVETIESTVVPKTTDVKPTETTAIPVETDIDPETLTKILNDKPQTTAKPVQTAEIPNTENATDESLTIKVENADAPEVSTDNKQAKAEIKPSPVVDTARIVLNLDETAVTDEVPVENTKPVIPTDTETEPVVKVTDNVAATVKETATKATTESTDVTTAKTKANEQMTNLQDTDTVVTDSQTGSNTDSSGDGSLADGEANEQILKVPTEDTTKTTSEQNIFGQSIDKVKTLNPALMAKNVQGKELNHSDILSQVNAKFDELQKNGNSKVSIVLRPESLGKVSIEIMNTKEGIIAKMSTDNPQAKEVFDKNMESLKSSLSAQGVNVSNIKVECTHESSNNMMGFEREQFNHNTSKDSNGNQQQSQGGENASGTAYTNSGDVEFNENTELKNTQTIIKHDGKVDYKV